ncbi:MAG: hypothetical protein GKR88_20395 [Flavobacteriaceae bacterium]|nr:MAG: hypothetical protein GKR88_20395 [Flavobacteriaceae bacterium]
MSKESYIERIKKLNKKQKWLLANKLKTTDNSKTELSGSKKIVAYIVGKKELDLEGLKDFVKQKLPAYMIPASFVELEEFPRLHNGKINTKALSEIKNITSVKDDHVAKERTLIQKLLIEIWTRVLNIDSITIHDNFFELGGDSIVSIRIVSEVRKQGIRLQPNDLFEYQTIEELSEILEPKSNSSGIKIQKQLTEIWERVLDIHPIAINDNFFELGGDSILSIRIISEARKDGITLQANDLFEYQSIAELSKVVKTQTSIVDQHTTILGKIPMLPIQYWFFDEHKEAPHFWNQTVTYVVDSSTKSSLVEQAIQKLVIHHDGLRQVFTSSDKGWESSILPIEKATIFQEVDISDFAKKDQDITLIRKLTDAQEKLKLDKGPLFKGYFFHLAPAQKNKLVLVAHHLIVDHVSWQLLLSDFSSIYSDLCTGRKVKLSKKTTSVKEWGEHLTNLARSDFFEYEKSYWQEQQVFDMKLPTDNSFELPLKESNIKIYQSIFEEDITSTLLETSSKKNITAEELLIASLIKSIAIWADISKVSIGMEQHGRKKIISNNDLSNTVGWMTSFFLLAFTFNNHEDTFSFLQCVKDKINAIPNGGIGYGALKYISKSIDINTSYRPLIIFNFLGRQRNETHDTIGQHEELSIIARSAKSERYHLFEINTYIKKQKLYVNWSYSKEAHNENTISKLVTNFKTTLLELIDVYNKEKKKYTPTDFPESGLSQEDLNKLFGY